MRSFRDVTVSRDVSTVTTLPEGIQVFGAYLTCGCGARYKFEGWRLKDKPPVKTNQTCTVLGCDRRLGHEGRHYDGSGNIKLEGKINV